MKLKDLKVRCWPYFWNNEIGLGIIIWYSGAEIVLGPFMLKVMWYDRNAGEKRKDV